MLTIAVCDDESSQRDLICQMLRSDLERRPGLAAKIRTFSSGQELLSAVKEIGEFDLYLLDIIMPELSGIALGVQLREMDCTGAIVYLTSSPEYAVDSYQTRAAYYLLKPVGAEQFGRAMDRALAVLRQQKAACIVVKAKSGLRRVPLDRILYVELSGRALRYELSGGECVESVTLRTSFQEAIVPLLADSRFFLCGSSFAVNLHYVSAVEKNHLLLDGGIRVPLSRGRTAAARRQWSSYWLGPPAEDPGG